MSLSQTVSELKADVVNGLSKINVGNVASGVVGLGVGGTMGYLAAKSRNKKHSTRGRKSKSVHSRKRSYTHHKKKGRYTPHTAGKRKDTSRKRIRYTKKGQPYVIGAHGKARFIKKSSARNSRKRSGGRY
jgi:hypothetical protein